MKLAGQLVLGFVLIVPVMAAGLIFHSLGEAAEHATDWLEGKVFGNDN